MVLCLFSERDRGKKRRVSLEHFAALLAVGGCHLLVKILHSLFPPWKKKKK